jgi:hypothetical protein
MTESQPTEPERAQPTELERSQPITPEPEVPHFTTSEPDEPQTTTSEPDAPHLTTSEPDEPQPTASEPDEPQPPPAQTDEPRLSSSQPVPDAPTARTLRGLLTRPQEPARSPLLTVGLWAVLLTWLYGTPLLLITGMIRVTSTLSWLSHQEAEPIARTTDAILVAGLVLNAALPLIGVVIAAWCRRTFWLNRFGLALVWAVIVHLAFLFVPGDVIGHNPGRPDPTPTVNHCIPMSGGRQCPGG